MLCFILVHFGSTKFEINSFEQCEQDVVLPSTHLVVVAAAESARAGSASCLARDEDEGSRVAGGPRAGRGTRGAGEGRLAVSRPDGVKLSLLGLQEDGRKRSLHSFRFE